MTTCAARQYSDQMHCAKCGLTWDMNDPEPPKCVTVADRELNKCYTALSRIKRRVTAEVIEPLRGVLNYRGGCKK